MKKTSTIAPMAAGVPTEAAFLPPKPAALRTLDCETTIASLPDPVLRIGRELSALNAAGTALFHQIADIHECVQSLRALAAHATSTHTATSQTIEWITNKQNRWMEATAIPADSDQAFVICRDTTLEATMRSALIDSRQRFKDLVEISSDFAWETDLSGNFTFVTTLGALDYPADSLVGTPARALLFHPETVSRNFVFEASEIVDGWELWLKRADGDAVCVLASARPILDKDGNRSGTRGICRDITTDRLRENDLARLKIREQVIDYIVDAVRDEAEPLDMLSTAVTSIGKALSDTACAVYQRKRGGKLKLIADFGVLPERNALATAVRRNDGVLSTEETLIDGRSVLMTATHYRSESNGAILLSRADGTVWSEHDRSLLNAVAAQLGIALRQIENQSELERLSRTDALTGLFNRRAYLEELEKALKRARRNQQSGAVFFVDLNNFKAVNDFHGHDIGDRVLIELADLLKETTRPCDFVSRLGGDEFALWLENIDKPSARRRAQEMLRRCRHLEAHSGSPDKRLGLSIGIAMYQPQTNEDSDGLLKRADVAMYRAKHSRKQNLSLARDKGTRDAEQ